MLTQPSSTIFVLANANVSTVSLTTLTMAANSTLNVQADPGTPTNTPFGLSFTGTILNGANTFNVPNNGTGVGTLTLGPLSNGNGAAITVTGGGNINVAGGTISGRLNLGGSSLSLGGASLTVGSLAGTGGTLSGDGPKVSLTVGSDGTSSTYAGNIVDGVSPSLALVKAGLGVLTLTGTNTYSGGTTVQDGTLSVVSDVKSRFRSSRCVQSRDIELHRIQLNLEVVRSWRRRPYSRQRPFDADVQQRHGGKRILDGHGYGGDRSDEWSSLRKRHYRSVD